MAKVDLSEFFDSGLEYENVPSTAHPEGHTYRVASPDAKTGLWLSQLAFLGGQAAVGANLSAADLASVKLDDDQEVDLYKRVLGPTYQQMLDDGVLWDWFEKIGQDAYLRFALSADVADAALAGPGKATPVPNRTEKRAAAKAGPKSARASGATAKPTRPRASTASSSRSRGSAAKKAQGRKAG